MFEIQEYLNKIDQKHYNKWLEGRYSVADLVDEHKMMALMFRKKILNVITEHSPKEMISTFEEKHPDIDIKDQQKAVERIECECREIKNIL